MIYVSSKSWHYRLMNWVYERTHYAEVFNPAHRTGLCSYMKGVAQAIIAAPLVELRDVIRFVVFGIDKWLPIPPLWRVIIVVVYAVAYAFFYWPGLSHSLIEQNFGGLVYFLLYMFSWIVLGNIVWMVPRAWKREEQQKKNLAMHNFLRYLWKRRNATEIPVTKAGEGLAALVVKYVLAVKSKTCPSIEFVYDDKEKKINIV